MVKDPRVEFIGPQGRQLFLRGAMKQLGRLGSIRSGEAGFYPPDEGEPGDGTYRQSALQAATAPSFHQSIIAAVKASPGMDLGDIEDEVREHLEPVIARELDREVWKLRGNSTRFLVLRALACLSFFAGAFMMREFG